MSSKLEVTLKRSLIRSLPEHRKTVQALGLKKVAQTVVKPDNEAMRGMIHKVRHLVEVKQVES